MSRPMYADRAKDDAAAIEDNIYNAGFERPWLLAMLPDIAEAKALDLSCGPGLYAHQHSVSHASAHCRFAATIRLKSAQFQSQNSLRGNRQ